MDILVEIEKEKWEQGQENITLQLITKEEKTIYIYIEGKLEDGSILLVATLLR